MTALTVFTPTYNRKHTIGRTFDSLLRQTSFDFCWLIIDDGSSDGTRQWVESLGNKTQTVGGLFDWMGCPTGLQGEDHFMIEVKREYSSSPLFIEYIYKPNGGLYTGYNVAYATIKTELCVCIDSDDYMPDDAVSNIIKTWKDKCQDKSNLGGLLGLDFNVVDGLPIGGEFKEAGRTMSQLAILHQGDCKHVMRTELMKAVCPQIGFEGEKDFNPYYMLMQVCDQYPLFVTNYNFCWVEYQTTGDSMSAGIWKQYVRSPKSYAKYRIMQMQMIHNNSLMNKIRLNIHYVSSCILSKDRYWIHNSPTKLLSLLFAPAGLLLYLFIKFKNR